MSNNNEKNGNNEFDFLLELAKEIGATDARIISSDKVVVEERVVLKCKSGCHMYGHKFVCPPFTPTPSEFQKMLNEYKDVLIVKFRAKVTADEDVGRSLLKNLCAPGISADLKERTDKFWEVWNEDKNRFLYAMLELEKAAFNRGYTLALALSPGSCVLCKKCNIEGGTCTHLSKARYPEHALGVNMKKTLQNIGMPVKFPFEGSPEGVGMLLIE